MVAKVIDKTRLIISKAGKILLENKNEPPVKVEVRINIALHMYSTDKPLNIYDLAVGDFEVYYRSQYEYKVKLCGEETGKVRLVWTKWGEYPKKQIVFQGKGKKDEEPVQAL